MASGRARASKRQIREYISEVEVELLSAIRFGGYGLWRYTEEIADILRDSQACTPCFDITVHRARRFLTESSLPRQIIGKYMVTMW